VKKLILLLAVEWMSMLPVWAQGVAPSRPAEKGCAWEQVQADSGLAAWVQRCDFGFRQIDLFMQGNRLMQRYSDSPASPEAVIEVFDLQAGVAIEAGVKRIFAEQTLDKKLARRCVLAPFHEKSIPADVRRYTFVPDAAYRKTLAAHAKKDEVPDPPCGDWGIAPDGIQYFEAQPGRAADRVMFVRVGQDAPLFDEQTLKLTGRAPIK
jgi:hypothetical protein